MNSNPSKFSRIVQSYRRERKLSLRAFADAISEKLPDRVSYQTIANWEAGEIVPAYSTFLPVLIHYGDWRRDFAADCLAALQPGYYEPMGPIGRAILLPEAG